jgi:hypothetical protein
MVGLKMGAGVIFPFATVAGYEPARDASISTTVRSIYSSAFHSSPNGLNTNDLGHNEVAAHRVKR